MENNLEYQNFLVELKEIIKKSHLKAVLTINREMLLLYWQIGKYILEKQQLEGWGAKIIDNLAKDLSISFPDMKGFSVRNLKYMRKFAEAYPDLVFVQPMVAQLSWTHHIILLDKFSDENLRMWYISKSIEQGWSKRVLMHQIELQAHKVFGTLPNNFDDLLPPLDSDLAQQIFKDEYVFDFITQDEKRKEADLEKELINNITQFLLTFGKLNFYLSVVDDFVKQSEDKPTIGLLLCKNKNSTIVEYALRDVSKPMGIASYQVTKKIPENLKDSLPTLQEIQKAIGF